MVANATDSLIQFDPAQQRFFADTARVIVVVWHRQKGKDFTAAAKAVDQAMRTGQDWYIVSMTQRQADATFAKCKQFAKAFKKMLKLRGRIEYGERDFQAYDKWIDHQFRFTARAVILPNGAKIESLPGRDPDTLAGLTGNVIFTEFGLFAGGGYDHWRVVFPLATRGYSVIVISTPRGKNTKLYELVSSPEIYSVHICDLYQSVAEGFVLRDNDGQPCSVEEFKTLYGDPSGWQREYECKFVGDLESLVKWAQLEAAGAMGEGVDFRMLRVERDGGWIENFFSLESPTKGRLEIGWDVARTGDVSSLWVNHTRPGMPRELRRLVLMLDTTFALQRRVVMSAMDASPGRPSVGCGDATGLGMDSNETMRTRYGDRWEPVTFTSKNRSDLASTLATSFDDNQQAIPPLDGPHKLVATDIYALQKNATGSNLKIETTDNPLLPESHCDIAWSAALANRAASLAGQTGGLLVI